MLPRLASSLRSSCPSFLSTEITQGANKLPVSSAVAHNLVRVLECPLLSLSLPFMFVSYLYFPVHICFSYSFSSCLFTCIQDTINTTSVISQIILTFHTKPLAWFRVEEYSGLTGRKGTTVVSVTRVLWFCVASQTSRRKRARDRILSHL